MNAATRVIALAVSIAWLTSANALPQLIRGPYVQLATPTSIVVRWRTDQPDGSLVVWGANLATMTSTNENDALVTDHQVLLTNLTPDTLYFYDVGSATETLAGFDASCYFRSHTLPGAPTPLQAPRP